MLNPSVLVAEKVAARQLLREAGRREMPVDARSALEELIVVIDKVLSFTSKGAIPTVKAPAPPPPPITTPA
jgi:hypothetical protein